MGCCTVYFASFWGISANSPQRVSEFVFPKKYDGTSLDVSQMQFMFQANCDCPWSSGCSPCFASAKEVGDSCGPRGSCGAGSAQPLPAARTASDSSVGDWCLIQTVVNLLIVSHLFFHLSPFCSLFHPSHISDILHPALVHGCACLPVAAVTATRIVEVRSGQKQTGGWLALAQVSACGRAGEGGGRVMVDGQAGAAKWRPGVLLCPPLPLTSAPVHALCPRQSREAHPACLTGVLSTETVSVSALRKHRHQGKERCRAVTRMTPYLTSTTGNWHDSY